MVLEFLYVSFETWGLKAFTVFPYTFFFFPPPPFVPWIPPLYEFDGLPPKCYAYPTSHPPFRDLITFFQITMCSPYTIQESLVLACTFFLKVIFPFPPRSSIRFFHFVFL